MMDAMLFKIESFMLKHQMASDGDGIVVGVSGGADSVALLSILKRLSERHSWQLYAVHVNHGLRGEAADADECFVQKLCEAQCIPCTVYHADIRTLARQQHLSEEEAGRVYRYQCFEAVRCEKGADKIAVAHHGDDAAETFLLNLFRGTGLQGLTGIPAVRGEIIRPMLILSRSEIENWLGAQGIFWRTDATNLETHYARNKIRNVILPYVTDEMNAGAVRHIREAADRLDRIWRYMENETDAAVKQYVHQSETGDGDMSIDLVLFDREDPVISEEVVRAAIGMCAGSKKDITAKHIQAVCTLSSQQTGRSIDLPYGLKILRSYDSLIITKRQGENKTKGNESLAVAVPGRVLLPDGKKLIFSNVGRRVSMSEIPVNECTKWLDYAKMRNGLVVRHKLPGDYLIIDGDGHQKTLKKWMKDEKIPAAQRDDLWVIACGSHIVWIPGYRISEYYKVDENTEDILVITLEGE